MPSNSNACCHRLDDDDHGGAVRHGLRALRDAASLRATQRRPASRNIIGGAPGRGGRGAHRRRGEAREQEVCESGVLERARGCRARADAEPPRRAPADAMMQKMHLPRGAIEQKMRAEGRSEADIAEFFGA